MEVPYQRARHYAYDGRLVNLLAQTWSNSRDSGPDPELLLAPVSEMNLFRSDPANDPKQDVPHRRPGQRLLPPTRADYERASETIRAKRLGETGDLSPLSLHALFGRPRCPPVDARNVPPRKEGGKP